MAAYPVVEELRACIPYTEEDGPEAAVPDCLR